MPDSWWPHGLQPTRLLRPWDIPGKSTGVGCHCLLQWICTCYHNYREHFLVHKFKIFGIISNNWDFTYASSTNIFSRCLTLFMICQPFWLYFLYDASVHFISQQHLMSHCLMHLQCHRCFQPPLLFKLARFSIFLKVISCMGTSLSHFSYAHYNLTCLFPLCFCSI